MYRFIHALFWLSTAGFIAAWFVGVCFLACLSGAIKRHGRLQWRDITLLGKPRDAHPAARYARGFIWCLLAGAGFWCGMFSIGLSSGILH